MRSTMQAVPLQIRRLLEHGTTYHGETRLMTATDSGVHSASYHEVGANAGRLANALRMLGVQPGERVATFMWNNQQHVEAYYAVPGMGAVLHPWNIRLAPNQVGYIADHAEDRVVIVDASLLPTLAPLLHAMRTIEHVVVNGVADLTLVDHIDATVHEYRELLATQPVGYRWPNVDEDTAAAMCYTSGTTGSPKGVVYSHRSIYLHAMAIALPDALGLSWRDRVLAIVPQFHVLAWGLPYAAFLTGASLAMPDRYLAPASLAAFITDTRPTKGAGVPTVWQSLLDYLDAHPEVDISSLREALVGGSACPASLMAAYEERHRVSLLHAWGMTETSPLGTVARLPARTTTAEHMALTRHRRSQGRFVAQVEARLVAPDGSIVAKDGLDFGELQVRGPWITGRYYRDTDDERSAEDWLSTGDIGMITPDGYLTLIDRAKDVIKSGEEWISSVELENHLVAHPSVPEAAVIGVPDHRWGERPMACVTVRSGEPVSAGDLRAFLASRVPKWQLPERWAFVGDIPKTSVGKIDKKALRRQYILGSLDVEFLA